MTQMTVFNPGARPAHLPALPSNASVGDLTAGVQASFPVLRMKGKVWSLTANGQTKHLTTPEGYAVPALRLVLVKANPHASKTFYRGNYSDGDNSPPDCWSFDGAKPDATVPQPMAASCAACVNNRIGSKVGEGGVRMKACGDMKRVAVLDLNTNTLMLLRLPYTSMKQLAKYGVWLSEQATPVNYNEILTELSFDVSKAHPEVQFKAVRWLEPHEIEMVQDALSSDALTEILSGGATEFDQPAAAPAPQQAPQADFGSLGERPAAAAPPPPPAQPAQPARQQRARQQAAPPPPPPAAPPQQPAPAAQPAVPPLVVESGSLEDALAQALNFKP